jgi:hypothetical protein
MLLLRISRCACLWTILAASGLACTTETDPDDGVGGSEAGAGGSGTTAGTGGTGAAGTSGDLPDGGSALEGCGSRSVTAATVVRDSIAASQTWSGTVYVQGEVSVVGGAVLTIEPGTHVIFAADAQLEVGWNSSAATLLAAGTEAAPIALCGQSDEAGFWKGLLIQNNVTSNSVLEHVLIADAGGSAQALLVNSEVKVSDVHVENSEQVGVRAAAFADSSARLSVSGTQGAAVVLTSSAALSPFPIGGEFTDNTDNTVHLDFTDVPGLTVLHDPSIPYVLDNAVDVTDGADLTFEAGVQMQFAADAGMDIGWNGGDVVLHVNGTADRPVELRGVSEEPGFWAGITIRSNVRTSSVLSHLQLRNAGGGEEGALRIEAKVKVNDVQLAQNEKGAWIGSQGLAAGSANLSITSTEDVPLTVLADALITLPAGGSFTGNGIDQIAVEAGDYTVSGTVPNLGVPYRVLGDIDTIDDSSMTIAAGTHFVMTADSDIEFGWNSGAATVIARGTASAPIQFSGVETTAGFWEGLSVGSQVLSSSALEYVEIADAGPSCLTLNRDLSVTNSSFSRCESYGISKPALDLTDYTSTNTFTSMGLGSVIDL